MLHVTHLFFVLIHITTLAALPLPTPSQVATVVGNSLIHHADIFINWEGGFQYGGAVTAEGLARAAPLVPAAVRNNWLRTLDQYLDRYMHNNNSNSVRCDHHQPYGPSNLTRSCAWSLLHNKTTVSPTSWELSTVGDSLGLFPLSFLDRYLHRQGAGSDATVAVTAMTTYVYPYHHHLHDNTISRAGGCCAPPPTTGNTAPFVWADDQFMGLALMSRLAATTTIPSLQDHTRRKWMDRAAQMQLNFGKYLLDSDGVSAHGAFVNGTTTVLHSCCKWGRANGWGALSRIEILKAIDDAFPQHPLRSALLVDFQTFMDSMSKYQSNDGRWHQVVNETSTYLETSVTAMMVTALATGVSRGWLEKTKYATLIENAWSGLVKGAINMTDGTVNGVCMGTGIQVNVSEYAKRPTGYKDSAPGGVGSVLMACSAMDQFRNT